MITTTLEAARILGVSQRQVQMAVKSGLLTATKLGRTLGVYEHQVFALERMELSGRRWDQVTWEAALDLLSGRRAAALGRTQHSRLKARLRGMSEPELVGRLLAGRVRLYRADAQQQRAIGSEIAGQMGLVGIGTTVLTSTDLEAEARRLNLAEDPEGNVVAIRTSPARRAVIEAVAFIAYGSTREESAGREWLKMTRTSTLAH